MFSQIFLMGSAFVADWALQHVDRAHPETGPKCGYQSKHVLANPDCSRHVAVVMRLDVCIGSAGSAVQVLRLTSYKSKGITGKFHGLNDMHLPSEAWRADQFLPGNANARPHTKYKLRANSE
jgi:hypothetical protein